jgi:hypothetical protein
MALYLALVLAGEFATVSDSIHSKRAAYAIIWGTTLGLTLAHVFAFNLAARLFERGRLGAEARSTIAYQVLVAIAVAIVLSLPLLVASLSTGLNFDRYLIAAGVGLTAFLVARGEEHSHVRAAAFAVAMLSLAVGVVLIKALVS